MNERRDRDIMTMYMSKSGKGCNMVTPNGKKNLFCNLDDLVHFLEGEQNFVTFTLRTRDVCIQSELESTCEDEKDE